MSNAPMRKYSEKETSLKLYKCIFKVQLTTMWSDAGTPAHLTDDLLVLSRRETGSLAFNYTHKCVVIVSLV